MYSNKSNSIIINFVVVVYTNILFSSYKKRNDSTLTQNALEMPYNHGKPKPTDSRVTNNNVINIQCHQCFSFTKKSPKSNH